LVYEFLLFAASDHTFRLGTLSLLFRRTITMNDFPSWRSPQNTCSTATLCFVLYCFATHRNPIFYTWVNFGFYGHGQHSLNIHIIYLTQSFLTKLNFNFLLLFSPSSKTGWANQQASAAGVVEIKTDEFPDDMNEKIQKVNTAMNHLTGTNLTTMIGQVDAAAQQALLAAGPAGALGIMPSAQLASVADAALDMALGVAPAAANVVPQAAAAPAAAIPAVVDAKIVGRSNDPTQHILVHNMFDKDEETEQGWEEDIKLDFEEECAQYGKIMAVIVMSKEVGGKIYASFDSVEGAGKCAKTLAGRWFDKRQLRVEFVDSVPGSA